MVKSSLTSANTREVGDERETRGGLGEGGGWGGTFQPP